MENNYLLLQYFIFFSWNKHDKSNILLITFYNIKFTVQSNHNMREDEAFCLSRFTVKIPMRPKYSQQCEHHFQKFTKPNSLTKAQLLCYSSSSAPASLT